MTFKVKKALAIAALAQRAIPHTTTKNLATLDCIELPLEIASAKPEPSLRSQKTPLGEPIVIP